MVVYKHIHDLGVYRNRLLAEVDGRSIRRLVLIDLVPRMIPDILDCVSGGWIWIKNIADEVLGVLG